MLVVAAGSACTSYELRRAAYAVGDQHACQAQLAERVGRGAAVAECADASHPGRSSFAAYERARAEAGAAAP